MICKPSYVRISEVHHIIDATFLPEESLEVSVAHERENEVGRLTLLVQTDTLHPQDIGVGEGAHDGALFQEAFELVIGRVVCSNIWFNSGGNVAG